jgi:signal transduction histidine kinase
MKSDASLRAGDTPRGRAAELAAPPAGQEVHRLLFDGMPGMAFLARTDRARTVELASAGSHLLLGGKPDHLPFALTPLIHPDDRDQVLEMVKAAVAGNHPFAIEYRLRHADGGWRTVWEQGRPFRRGAAATVQGHLVDVTQRLQREQARLGAELRLLQTQKFYALNHLAAGVAHEFNNLVAGILGSAELLAMDLPETHPGHETLKQIFEASNHARDFVHKLRMLGQRPAPDFKPIRLQPVLEECLQILRNIIPPRIELQARIDANCPKVNADAAQIHQAVMDLCLQAWQGLADRRGHIRMTLENLPGGRPPSAPNALAQPGPHVCLTVQDDGPGLEKHAHENLFQPFRHRRSGGKKVGLELFLVRETIQAHHGEIFSESNAGQGLTFRIYLPAALEK